MKNFIDIIEAASETERTLGDLIKMALAFVTEFGITPIPKQFPVIDRHDAPFFDLPELFIRTHMNPSVGHRGATQFEGIEAIFIHQSIHDHLGALNIGIIGQGGSDELKCECILSNLDVFELVVSGGRVVDFTRLNSIGHIVSPPAVITQFGVVSSSIQVFRQLHNKIKITF